MLTKKEREELYEKAESGEELTFHEKDLISENIYEEVFGE